MSMSEKDLTARQAQVGLAGGAAAAGGWGLDSLAAQMATANAAGFPSLADVAAEPLMFTGGALVAGAVAHAVWSRSTSQRLRRDLGQDGWITARDLLNEAGAIGVRRTYAERTRPDLTGRGKPNEYGQNVGRIVSGSSFVKGRCLYVPWSLGLLLVGPPGSGKSQFLINRILDAPGAAYVSTTKAELYKATAKLREALGRVLVFNPRNVAGIYSTLGWSPVEGCHDQAVAQARAAALVRGGAAVSENAEFFAQKAVEILRCYLMAAALDDLDMRAVARWCTDDQNPEPIAILEHHSNMAPSSWVHTLRSYLEGDGRALSNYMATLTPCVAFMSDPAVAIACTPAPSQRLDMRSFLREAGTIYVIAGDEDRRLTPLITAFTEFIMAEAKKTAGSEPSGRLAPGLAMILDEVAQTSPVPLDQWASDSRGWGVDVTVTVQALSSLRKRYGRDATDTIISSLTMQIGLPGMGEDDLEHFARRAGTRQVVKVSAGESDGPGGTSRSSHRQVATEPVVSADVLRRLPQWHALVFGPRRKAAVVRFEPGYKRATRELRAMERAEQKAARQAEQAEEREHAAAAAKLETVEEDA